MMLKTIKTQNTNKSITTTTSAQAGGGGAQVNANFNNDEIDIFKTLIDCTNDISKLRQFIFYVGTSCDNKNLRRRLKFLQDKLFQNILKQKESIAQLFRRSTRSNSQSQITKFRESELIRFTLTTLSYFESLIQRLVHLTSAYPLREKIELVINLGFEDSDVEENDEYSVKNEIKNEIIKEADAIIDSNNTESIKAPLEKQICYLDEALEFKNCLKMIQNLIEEIELMDVNLLRFNIKTNETNEFFKNLKEMNKSNTRMRHERRHSSDSSDEEAGTRGTNTGGANTSGTNARTASGKKKKTKTFKTIKNSTIKEFCNRRKIIYTILIIGLLCCVIAVICGLVFGLKQ